MIKEILTDMEYQLPRHICNLYQSLPTGIGLLRPAQFLLLVHPLQFDHLENTWSDTAENATRMENSTNNRYIYQECLQHLQTQQAMNQDPPEIGTYSEL